MQGDFFLTQWAFLGMRWLYETLTNESIVLTVIIATLIIRCLTVFGDIKSRKSSMDMQRIQPQLDKIRKKYENDPQRLNVEQRKIMKENNVSMFGGCLPMLFTLPLFFVFIGAFRQWGNEMMAKLIVTMDADPAAGLEFFKHFKFLWVNNMWAADNGFKPVIMQATEFFSKANAKLPNLLYFIENPSALETFVRLGFFTPAQGGGYTLAAATEQLTARYNELLAPCINLYAGQNNGWFIFPLLACVTTFFSSWIMMRKQPKTDATGGSSKMMQYTMPLLSFWFCLTSNAAFALYWTASNVFSLITTILINRRFDQKAAEAAVEVPRK